jgi:hypothetical protein
MAKAQVHAQRHTYFQPGRSAPASCRCR